MEKELKTFISYSHDSEDHRRTILAFADQLRRQGIDCNLDQYEESPETGWISWMEAGIKDSDYVLVVCTQGYAAKIKHENEGYGKGVKWEGAIITQELYESEGKNRKFIPVLLLEDDKIYIPRALRSYTYYNILTKDGYEKLYRRITKQPAIKKPPVGKVIKFPGKGRNIFNLNAAPGKDHQNLSQAIVGNNNFQIGTLRGNLRLSSGTKTRIGLLPAPGTIGANALLKQAITDRFNKLGDERKKRFGERAYGAMYNIFKREFGMKRRPWTDIWNWPEATADRIIKYLDCKYANTKTGRIEGAVQRGSLIPSKGHLYKREKELLAQLDLEISSPEVKASLKKYFGVDSHTKLESLNHWQWVMHLEKLVRLEIGEKPTL